MAIEQSTKKRTVQMAVKLGPLTLANPVIAIAGTCGLGDAYAPFTFPEELGAITTPTLTPRALIGMPQPRFCEVRGGILHATGGENPGVEAFVLHELHRLKNYKMTVIANIGGNSFEEFCHVARVLATSDVDAIELSTGCMCNELGHAFGAHPDAIHRLCEMVSKETNKPIIVKLIPRVTDLAICAEAAEDGGAQILSLVGAFPAMYPDVKTGKSTLGAKHLRLSGPAILPQALQAVYEVREASRLPIIGMGGVTTTDDAIRMMMVGANAVGVGSAIFAQPALADQIKKGLRVYCQERGIRQVSKLTGSFLED